MRPALRSIAIAALVLAFGGVASCGYGYYGYGYGYGYGYDDGYGYDYCDVDPYCYAYYFAMWSPTSLTVTDFDADGTPDVVVGDGLDGTVWFARGQPGGGLTGTPAARFTLPGASATVAAVNADGDASPDLVILDGQPGSLTTYTGDGHGGFTSTFTTPLSASQATPGVMRFARGLLNGDALDDVVTLDETGSLHVALGTGVGAFVAVGGDDPAATFLGLDAGLRLAGVSVALADFDAAPGVDLLVMDGERATFAIFSGRADGTFGAAQARSFVPLGDVLAIAPVTLGSGRPADLAVLSGDRESPFAPSTLVVLRGSDGVFAFDSMPVGTARALLPRDLDGDGLTDLLLGDAAAHEIRTLHAHRVSAPAPVER